jgi:hypothetical protein
MVVMVAVDLEIFFVLQVFVQTAFRGRFGEGVA